MLTSTLSWHWIFLVNLPIGAVVIALSLRLLSNSLNQHPSRDLDVAGALTVTASLMLAVYASSMATRWAGVRCAPSRNY
ncbi:hypothetical protein QNM99_11615 [Pseudomonas sp. PCH446]